MRAWTGFLLAWFVALASRRSRVAADDGRLPRRPWPSPHRRDQDGRLSRTRPKVFRTGCTFALCLAAAVGAQPGRLHRRWLAISVGRQRKQGGEREIAPVRQARMESQRHAGLEGRKAARPEIGQQDRRPIAVVERPRFRPQAQAEIARSPVVRGRLADTARARFALRPQPAPAERLNDVRRRVAAEAMDQHAALAAREAQRRRAVVVRRTARDPAAAALPRPQALDQLPSA